MKNRPVSTVIDLEKCTGCGLCVEICPSDTLSLVDGQARVTGQESLGCDQCAAVCPVGAVRVERAANDALKFATVEVPDSWLPYGEPDLAGLVHLMRSRRSCRRYEAQAVSAAMLEDLVRIGTTAPSGTNSQRWAFTILPDRESVVGFGAHVGAFFRRLNKLARNPIARFYSRLFLKDVLGNYYREYLETVEAAILEEERGGRERLFHGATAAILVASKPGASCPSDDCHLATQNILLAAHAMGLGTCLIGFAVEAMKGDRRVQRAVGIPSRHRVYSVIALGWPAVRYRRTAGRFDIVPATVSAKDIPPPPH